MLRPVALGVLLLASVVVSPASATGSVEQLYFVEHESEQRATGVLDEGETRAFSFAVDEANLTRMDFLLMWRETGDATGLTGPDQMALSVTGPEGRADARGPDASGDLHVRIPVSVVPPAETVPVDRTSRRLAELATREGAGEWVARVRLTDVGNPAGLAKLDEGNGFELLVVLTTYEAVPSLLVPQVAAAAHAPSSASVWGLATIGLAALVAILGIALLRPWGSRLLPRRGNTLSARVGHDEAPPRGDDPPYMAALRD